MKNEVEDDVQDDIGSGISVHEIELGISSMMYKNVESKVNDDVENDVEILTF